MHKSWHHILVRSSMVSVALAMSPVVAAQASPDAHAAHHSSPEGNGRNSPLVNKVRAATARFLDINLAANEGWVRGTPCVSGPNSGAMGVHFILPARVGDGSLNATEPEALIYEPLPNGSMRLVGVEFIVLAADWAKLHPEGGTPAVDGHLTHYVGGTEPLRVARLLRAARVGMGEQSEWRVR